MRIALHSTALHCTAVGQQGAGPARQRRDHRRAQGGRYLRLFYIRYDTLARWAAAVWAAAAAARPHGGAAAARRAAHSGGRAGPRLRGGAFPEQSIGR
jgi:hypothetical protein